MSRQQAERDVGDTHLAPVSVCVNPMHSTYTVTLKTPNPVHIHIDFFQPSHFIRHVSLCSRQQLTQRFTTGQSVENKCQSAQPHMKYICPLPLNHVHKNLRNIHGRGGRKVRSREQGRDWSEAVSSRQDRRASLMHRQQLQQPVQDFPRSVNTGHGGSRGPCLQVSSY